VSRYSQLYIDQSAPLPDSKRARYRLGKLIEETVGNNALVLKRRLHVIMPVH
jgi:hypothetical protein